MFARAGLSRTHGLQRDSSKEKERKSQVQRVRKSDPPIHASSFNSHLLLLEQETCVFGVY